MAATHSLDHPSFTEGCYLCRLRSVSISPAALPTRQDVRYSETDKLDKSWQADIPSYRRLVKGGYQPETVDGAAEVEKQVDAHA